MQRFLDEGFVIDHDLNTAAIQPLLLLRGRVRCEDGRFLDVSKTFAVTMRSGRPWIKTEDCSYHAGIQGRQARAIFRYDNAHPYPGHPDSYHRHRFDPETWPEIDPPEWIGRANWPHLSDALEELRSWWNTIGRFLAWE